MGASSTGERPRARLGISQAKPIDPRDLGKQPQHLAEREDDTDQQHDDDQRVEAGISQESLPDRAVEDERQQSQQDQKNQHPDQENPGR